MPHILVAEDDATTREMIRGILTKEGYDVSVAADTNDKFLECCSWRRQRQGGRSGSRLGGRRGRENKIQILKAKRLAQNIVEACRLQAASIF